MDGRRKRVGRLALGLCLVVALGLAWSAQAALRTVTLAVEGMTCPSCPYIVRRTLERVPGVREVRVSYAERKAVVTYDDARARVEDLTAATAAMGYPARPLTGTRP
ncbi:cation transporter [Inmirania thermothiophila]|uniref:Mercuric ion binding protein n=1 Tax=Inmirania thermothiophila TaxID=1750597 RepID=A0A3N1Y404_9GAMM|nr:cation transporter [Inmirania thermothiophila]ROR32342.1 mercuric ion binding protein [Inmirania thermothiophila]